MQGRGTNRSCIPTEMEQTVQPWRAWLQANITVFVLTVIVVTSLLATIGLMHEDMILDKYVTWMESFCQAALTSLALAMKTAGGSAGKKDDTPQ